MYMYGIVFGYFQGYISFNFIPSMDFVDIESLIMSSPELTYSHALVLKGHLSSDLIHIIMKSIQTMERLS